MIALSMIVSGAEKATTLNRCLDSIQPFVDDVFITITTPDENNLEELLKVRGVNIDVNTSFFTEVTQEDVDFLTNFGITKPFLQVGDRLFQFDRARNHNLGLIPKNYDWVLWMDADDVFRGADKLREVVKESDENGKQCVFFNYVYHAEIKDNKVIAVLIEHLRERLIKNDGSFEWLAPVHETLIEKHPTQKYDSEKCDVLHITDGDKLRGALERNIKILEMSVVKTRGADPRPVYYLAKAYFDLRIEKPEYLDLALPLFEKYEYGTKDFEFNNKSGWPEERSQCWDYLSEVYRMKGQLNNAIKASMNGIIEDERFPFNYVSLAMSYVLKGEYERALFFVRQAVALPRPQTTLIHNPRDLAARILEIVYHASINLSKLDEAWAASQKMATMFPEDETINERLTFTTELREQREMTKEIIKIAQKLEKTGEAYKIIPLIQAAPSSIVDNPFIQKIRNRVMPSRKWGEDEIAIFCGPGYTAWGPEIMKHPGENFVGGSEEAVICLSRELAKEGWKVTVFGEPGPDEGEHEGVKYVSHYKINKNDDFNIMVYWRQPGLLDWPIKAKKKYVWCHDIQNQLDYTPERIKQVEKVIVLSPWHRSNLPDIEDYKIMVSSNGI